MWATPLGRNETPKDVHGRTDLAMVRKANKLACFRPFDHFQVEAGFQWKEGSYKPGATDEEKKEKRKQLAKLPLEQLIYIPVLAWFQN